MHLYEDQFSETHDFPLVDKPSKVLIVASTPRCGSHMLGHALHQTGSFGFPLEYTQAANFAEWKRRLAKVDFDETLTEIQRRRTSPNGVFGIKIHYSHVFEYGGFQQVMRRFPNAHYVFLSRSAVLKQAVSLAVAQQTGVWISGQKPIDAKPQYEFERINECLRRILLENAGWRYLLAAHGCRHMELEFDAVRRDVAGAITNIASFLGITVDPQRLPRTQVTAKQSNDLNAAWAERFLADFTDREEYLLKPRADPLRRIKRALRRA
jgi:LPS sulfotransferase NodH